MLQPLFVLKYSIAKYFDSWRCLPNLTSFRILSLFLRVQQPYPSLLTDVLNAHFLFVNVLIHQAHLLVCDDPFCQLNLLRHHCHTSLPTSILGYKKHHKVPPFPYNCDRVQFSSRQSLCVHQ